MTTSARLNLSESGCRNIRGLLFVVLMLCVGASAIAQDQRNAAEPQPGASKDELIHELVALTDAAQLQAVFTRRLIDRVAGAVAMFAPAMDARTMRIVREEATEVVSERIESGDALYSVLYPVYEKHFNIFELNQLVNFYQSPLGQKLVRVSPQLLTESLALGQQWGLSLVPEIAERVQARLAESP